MKPLNYFLLLAALCICSVANGQWLKKIPSADNLYREAREETEKKNYNRALYLANEAHDITPRDLDIRLLLGRLYMLTNKYDSARPHLNYIIEKDGKYRDAYIYLVNIEMTARRYPQALQVADKELANFPDDKDFLMKKFEILNQLGSYPASERIAERLLYLHPSDIAVRNVYVDQKSTLARNFMRRGNFDRAKAEYNAVLEADPTNKEALDAVFNLDVRSGNYESSLAYTNWALQANPDSYEYLYKKAGILQEMLRYADAITVAQTMLRKFPNDRRVQELNINLRMEAGRYYMNTDPYLQFIAVLEKQPTNREALNYVINIAFSRGLYADALPWINRALKYNSNDVGLLDKKISVLEKLDRFGQAADIAERAWLQSPTTDNKNRFFELTIQSGRQFLADMQYDSALATFYKILYYEPANATVLNYAVAAFVAQKDYDDALRLVDRALASEPRNEVLLFKKAGILEAYDRLEQASEITLALSDKHAGNSRYRTSFVDQSMALVRNYMQYNDYENAIARLRIILDKDPFNRDAFNYMINMQSAIKDHDSALHYIDMALAAFPGSKEFLLKKSSVLSDSKLFREAYAISKQLYETYPYNTQYKTAYADQLLASGRQYQQRNMPDSALGEYIAVLDILPRDTAALLYAINILNDKQAYSSALVYIEQGQSFYPGNQSFLLKKAVVYENMQNYDAAALAADTLVRLNNVNESNKDYARYLLSRTLKNETGLFFLRSTFDDETKFPGHIATIQYLRRYKQGSITGRINYAGRPQGTGFQFELESYYNHSKKWYSYGGAAYSNTIVFPRLRLAYSLFHNMKKGWEAEVGGRYLYADSFSSVSIVASGAKTIGSFWMNLRGYGIKMDNNWYGSGALTSRYYLDDKRTDYFSLILGYGTAPDDRSRNFNFAEQVIYNTVSVGAGFQKAVRYRTLLGLYGTWINQQLSPENFQNQYDLYFMITQKF